MLLTVKEVQKQLNVSRASVYRLIERGEIASHRIGSSIRISEADLQDYLRSVKIQRTEVIQPKSSCIQLNNLQITD